MKRRIRTILLFLLLGAIVNVAVAWGLALWRSPIGDSRTGRDLGIVEHGRSSWEVVQYTEPGTLTICGIGHLNARHRWYLPIYSEQDPERLNADVLPRWSRFRNPPDALLPADLQPQRLDIARGWPSLCLRHELDASLTPDALLDSPPAVRSGLDLGVSRGSAFEAQVLPLGPIWPGFAVNTLFYAVLLWLSFAGVRLGRRLVRSRRGHCPSCNYDLQGDLDAGCPEYGGRRETSGEP